MKTNIEKLPNNTYKINITDSKEAVQEAYDHALKHEAENIEVKGFRKGKAPLPEVKKNIDMAKLRGHALNHLLSDIYEKVIKENHLKPILQPRFDVKQFDEGEELDVDIIIIERPDMKIGDYKSALVSTYKKINQGKTDDALPLTNQQIVDVILQNCEIGISDILIEEETNRMMASLIDQTAKLGVTTDDYLKSINKTTEQLREDYLKSAELSLKGEFLVTEIAQEENVTISDEEIDQTINAVPDEKSKEALQKPEQRMYIKAVLMKNKALQQLGEYAKTEAEKSDDKKPAEKKSKTDKKGSKEKKPTKSSKKVDKEKK